ncbi:hypothetical protein BDN71DRAFT_1388786, partial [Pleurotus eryngii]
APIPPTFSHLRCTQDLLGRFQLHSAYDKYVRAFAAPHDTTSDALNSASGGALDKGKGRERDPLATTPATGATPGPDAHDGDDDDAGGSKADKKKKNNYKHLIKDIPGKHSMKKDDYLSTMIQIPPKQHIRIAPFDQRTQRDAFTVSLEGLKGWNPSALIQESAQAREDRKKRKELKRLAKAHLGVPPVASAVSALPSTPTIPSSQPQQIPLSIPIPNNPATTLPPAKHSILSTTSRPITASSAPRPGSAVPRPGSARPLQQPQRVNTSTPVSVAQPNGGVHGFSSGQGTNGSGPQARGVKREREDVAGTGTQNRNGIGVNGTEGVNGVGGGHGVNGGGPGANPYIDSGNPSKVIVAAKAGAAGVRPRPIKRQRMVSTIPGFRLSLHLMGVVC